MGRRVINFINRFDIEVEFLIENKGVNFNWLVMVRLVCYYEDGKYGVLVEVVVSWREVSRRVEIGWLGSDDGVV